MTEGSTGGKLASAREYNDGKITLLSAPEAKKTKKKSLGYSFESVNS